MIDINYLYKKGQQLFDEEHAAEESSKLGNLRGGNAGLLTEGGLHAGSCLRKAHLRKLGVSANDITDRTKLMFEGGHSNEDIWVKNLSKSYSGVIKCETDIPVLGRTKGGTKITGRPDVVLCDQAGNPELGLELKGIFSPYKAADIGFSETPDTANIAQTLFYAKNLDVPFQLWYTSRYLADVPFWKMKMAPLEGEQGSELVRWRGPKSAAFNPFQVGFEINTEKGGDITYRVLRDDGSREGTEATVFKYQDVERFYEYADTLDQQSDLGPRPYKVNASTGKKGYKLCDYCPFKDACDSAENKGYDEWLATVKETPGVDNG